MDIGHHGSNPAHIEVFAARAFLAGQQLSHIALHRFFPVALIRHVDGEFTRIFRNLEVFLSQAEGANLAIQGKDMDAVAEGQH